MISDLDSSGVNQLIAADQARDNREGQMQPLEAAFDMGDPAIGSAHQDGGVEYPLCYLLCYVLTSRQVWQNLLSCELFARSGI